MDNFNAILEIIGRNPFVYVPAEVLNNIFHQAKKRLGHIPVRGSINGKPYLQTLVKYSGDWRLYINMVMLKNSPKRIGEVIDVKIEYDPSDRTIEPHPKLAHALSENNHANTVFKNLSPSRQKEIVRYISNLKSETSALSR